MNLIMCSEDCKHQNDGYCCLEDIAKITDAVTTSCCYFEKRSGGAGSSVSVRKE